MAFADVFRLGRVVIFLLLLLLVYPDRSSSLQKPSGGEPSCPPGWHLSQVDDDAKKETVEKCFKHFLLNKTWSDAFDACANEHATLLQLQDDTTEREVYHFIKPALLHGNQTGFDVWIGLRRIHDYFQWLGANPQPFINSNNRGNWTYGTTWASGEPRIWDACISMNIGDGKLKSQSCAGVTMSFVCVRNTLNTTLIPVVYCDESSGWLGHEFFFPLCLRVGREQLSWKEALKDCSSTVGAALLNSADLDNNDTISLIRNTFQIPDQSWFFKPGVHCKLNSVETICGHKKKYVCQLKQPEPVIRVLLVERAPTLTNRTTPAIWKTINDMSKITFLCKVFINGKALNDTKSVRYLWSRNGVYIKGPRLTSTIPAFWPFHSMLLDKDNRLPDVLGTYKCQVRLPTFGSSNFSSEPVSIFLKDLHVFRYSLRVTNLAKHGCSETKNWESTAMHRFSDCMKLLMNSLLGVLPEDPTTLGFTNFKWIAQSVTPGSGEMLLRVFVGVNVSRSSPSPTPWSSTIAKDDTRGIWLKLWRYKESVINLTTLNPRAVLGKLRSAEIEFIEWCPEEKVTAGPDKATVYMLRMRSGVPNVISDPTCYDKSTQETVTSLCHVDFVLGARWQLANYTNCQLKEGCESPFIRVINETCAREFPEAASWQEAWETCRRMKAHLPVTPDEIPNIKKRHNVTSWLERQQPEVVIYDLVRNNTAADRSNLNAAGECVYVTKIGSSSSVSSFRCDCGEKREFLCLAKPRLRRLWSVPWCPTRWVGSGQPGLNRTCFFINQTQGSSHWEARHFCAQMGAYLVVLNRSEKVDAIGATLAHAKETLGGFWTALEKTDDGNFWKLSVDHVWIKADDERVSVRDDSFDGVALFPEGTEERVYWKGVPLNARLGFVCERLSSGNILRESRVNLEPGLFNTRNKRDVAAPLSRTKRNSSSRVFWFGCSALSIRPDASFYWFRNGEPLFRRDEVQTFRRFLPATGDATDYSGTPEEYEGDITCEVWDPERAAFLSSNTAQNLRNGSRNFVLVLRLKGKSDFVHSLKQASGIQLVKLLGDKQTVIVMRIGKIYKKDGSVQLYFWLKDDKTPAGSSEKDRIAELREKVAEVMKSKGADPRDLEVEVRIAGACLEETFTTERGVLITWPRTPIGMTALPSGQLCMTVDGQPETRECMGDFVHGGEWESKNRSYCEGKATNTTASLFTLSESNVTTTTAARTATELQRLTTDAKDKLQPVDITYIATTIHKLSQLGPVGKETLHQVARTVDYLMTKVDADKIHAAHNRSGSSSMITESLETMANSVTLDPDRPSVEIRLSSVYVATQDLSAFSSNDLVVGVVANRPADNSMGSAAFNSSNVMQLRGGNVHKLNYATTDAALILPLNLVENRTRGEGGEQHGRLTFIIYEDSRLFSTGVTTSGADKKGNGGGNLAINSRVVTANFLGPPATNLDPPVRLIFHPLRPVHSFGSVSCVFWDVQFTPDHSNWSDAGCWPVATNATNMVECHCNHMTNFAVIMDVYGQEERVTGEHKQALDYITYIGCGVSIVALVLTVLTFAALKKWRKKMANKVLCNLAVALLCHLVIFLVGIEQTDIPGMCMATAVLMHYFLLASFCWMLVEAVHQYLSFVKVFDTYIPRFVVKAMLFAWGVPLLIVICVLSVDVNLYRGGQHYCWLSLDGVYYTFLLPVGLIVLTNAVVFILVIKGITCDRQSVLRSNQSKRQLALAQLYAAACIFVLLGLTWVFGFFALASLRLVFQYLFCIFNSLQGLFIFLFMVVRERNAKDLWLLLCFRKEEGGVRSGTAFTNNQNKKNKNKNADSRQEEHNFSENGTYSTKLATSRCSSRSSTILANDCSGGNNAKC